MSKKSKEKSPLEMNTVPNILIDGAMLIKFHGYSVLSKDVTRQINYRVYLCEAPVICLDIMNVMMETQGLPRGCILPDDKIAYLMEKFPNSMIIIKRDSLEHPIETNGITESFEPYKTRPYLRVRRAIISPRRWIAAHAVHEYCLKNERNYSF